MNGLATNDAVVDRRSSNFSLYPPTRCWNARWHTYWWSFLSVTAHVIYIENGCRFHVTPK